MSTDSLYPVASYNRSAHLTVSDRHQIWWAEAGNPQGPAVLFVHGGPGGGTSPKATQFFDPDFWRIILVDQRGAGQSLPFAEIEDNTTADLVADYERLRGELGIERWLLFGGSWGSTLALVYAETHPEVVSGLVLRGVTQAAAWEDNWLFHPEGGAATLFPDAWQDFVSVFDEAPTGSVLDDYYLLLKDKDEDVRAQAAEAWSRWEAQTSTLYPNADLEADFVDPKLSIALARLECHYFIHHCFLEPNQIARDLDRITHLPVHIVQGRYDVVCPMRSAWDLHRRWPGSRLEIIPAAGHSTREPGIAKALVGATDAFKETVRG